MSERKSLLFLVLALSLSFLSLRGLPAEDERPARIEGIGPAGPIVKLHTGFKFTEGPAADREGNVYFSDIPNQRIHKVDADGKLSVFRENSNHANGLMLNAKGEIVACEMDGRIAAYSPDGKSRRVLADKYDGKRFNAPNDLVIDGTAASISPTPPSGAQSRCRRARRPSTTWPRMARCRALIDDLPNPNGVILSPDEKTLYVIPSRQAEMMAYPVEAPGKIGKGRVFCTLKQRREGRRGAATA